MAKEIAGHGPLARPLLSKGGDNTVAEKARNFVIVPTSLFIVS